MNPLADKFPNKLLLAQTVNSVRAEKLCYSASHPKAEEYQNVRMDLLWKACSPIY